MRFSSNTHDEKHVELTISIAFVTHNQSSAHRTLRIKLTDEQDPFFLHTLEVTEAEFHSLKKEQSLLIDFGMFPQNFIELLEQCLQCRDEETPKFVAVFHMNQIADGGAGLATLSVVETNQFKHLQHLSLRFRPANDSAIKDYLAGKLSQYKLSQLELQQELTQTKECLTTKSQECQEAKTALSTIHQKTSQNVAEIQQRHAAAVTDLKEKALQDRLQLQTLMQNQADVLKVESKAQAGSSAQKIQELSEQNRELTETKFKLESSLQQTTSSLESMQQTLTLCRNELKQMREKNSDLDTSSFNNQTTINQQNLRLAQLEQQAKDKTELIDNMSKTLEAVRAQKAGVEDALGLYKRNFTQAESKLKECVGEINKGNKIIQHLQNDVRSYRQKVKLKSSVIAQQEKLVAEKSNAMTTARAEIAELKHSVQDRASENQRLQQALAGMKNQLEEARKQLGSSNQVINWLNKELNSSKLGRIGMGGSAGTNLSSSMNMNMLNMSLGSTSAAATGMLSGSARGPLPTMSGGSALSNKVTGAGVVSGMSNGMGKINGINTSLSQASLKALSKDGAFLSKPVPMSAAPKPTPLVSAASVRTKLSSYDTMKAGVPALSKHASPQSVAKAVNESKSVGALSSYFQAKPRTVAMRK